jgi:hypothetical protein
MSNRYVNLDALEVGLNTATPTPWRSAPNRHPNCDGSPWGWIVGPHDVRVAVWSGRREQENAEAIAAMRNALPALIAELRELRSGLESIRNETEVECEGAPLTTTRNALRFARGVAVRLVGERAEQTGDAPKAGEKGNG